ncbi:MAG: hypothetical protein JNK26_00675 [Candidatus Doudnabacteria bacterium]|nr:hypothetical protein [Candidatus Doudnabacteria bacterium]
MTIIDHAEPDPQCEYGTVKDWDDPYKIEVYLGDAWFSLARVLPTIPSILDTVQQVNPRLRGVFTDGLAGGSTTDSDELMVFYNGDWARFTELFQRDPSILNLILEKQPGLKDTMFNTKVAEV